MYHQMPSHVSKEATKNIPLVGPCSVMYGCLFLTRDNKDSKRDMFTQIADRQKEIDEGKYPPLIFYAEGGTSNGTHLLKFKKGGFIGLKSVQPVVIQYQTPIGDFENCVLKIQEVLIFYATNYWVRCTVKRFPVFEPNDYFFKNFQQEGEEKWETFARVIRDIMAEHTGLIKSDL